MIPLNYHHLYYFYVVAKAGSIAKACDKLLLAQPTVSTQLKQMEKVLGRPLFERKKQRLSLTEEGRLALDYAESIFDLGQELLDALRGGARGKRPALQVGVLNGSPRAFGQALLESLWKDWPSAHVTVQEGGQSQLIEDLRLQRLDVVLTDVSIHGPDQEEFANHLVGRVPILLAAAPSVARRYKNVPQDLNGAPFLLPAPPNRIYHQVLDLFAEWKVQPHVVAEVQDVELARHLALKGHGIVPINAYSISISLPAKGLAVLQSRRPLGLYESVYLVTRKRKWPHPLVEHLVQKFRLPARVR